jgi:spore germination protein YaaH
MATKYTVRAGDTLTSIAAQFGIPNWQALYHDPGNAAFRALRPNPDVIAPGDILFIPSSAPHPFKYSIQAGDTLTSIAAQFGIPNWQALYNDPANAAFRSLRPNPDVIVPGDILLIRLAGRQPA